MTNRDRDSAARLLRELADRLAGWPAKAAQQADDHAQAAGISEKTNDLFRPNYLAASLAGACDSEAKALRFLVDQYLMPRLSKVRGPRGRR